MCEIVAASSLPIHRGECDVRSCRRNTKILAKHVDQRASQTDTHVWADMRTDSGPRAHCAVNCAAAVANHVAIRPVILLFVFAIQVSVVHQQPPCTDVQRPRAVPPNSNRACAASHWVGRGVGNGNSLHSGRLLSTILVVPLQDAKSLVQRQDVIARKRNSPYDHSKDRRQNLYHVTIHVTRYMSSV